MIGGRNTYGNGIPELLSIIQISNCCTAFLSLIIKLFFRITMSHQMEILFQIILWQFISNISNFKYHFFQKKDHVNSETPSTSKMKYRKEVKLRIKEKNEIDKKILQTLFENSYWILRNKFKLLIILLINHFLFLCIEINKLKFERIC